MSRFRLSLPRPERRSGSPLRAFLRLLWQAPLFAIVAALFFGTLFGRGWHGYVAAYQISLVFAYAVSISMWAVGNFVAPRWFPPSPKDEGRFNARAAREAMLYMAASIGASFLAAAVVHFTLLPGFLGSARQVAVIGLFAFLFSVLSMAIVYAFVFYHRALDRARAEEELNLARRIQRSFLLSDFPELPGLEVHATNLSSRQVSGDFYDVVPAGPNAWLIAIADVSGKGVPAALLTSMLQASLRTLAPTTPSVAAILAAINRVVVQRAPAGQFATFFLARVDLDPPRLTYSNAGHNFPVLCRAGGGLELLETGGTVVGVLDGATFDEASVALGPGDRLVLYTDGVSEAANAAGEMFGEERLHALVAASPVGTPARALSDHVLASVRAFLAGEEAGDDITLLTLRVLEREPAPAPRA